MTIFFNIGAITEPKNREQGDILLKAELLPLSHGWDCHPHHFPHSQEGERTGRKLRLAEHCYYERYLVVLFHFST